MVKSAPVSFVTPPPPFLLECSALLSPPSLDAHERFFPCKLLVCDLALLEDNCLEDIIRSEVYVILQVGDVAIFIVSPL